MPKISYAVVIVEESAKHSASASVMFIRTRLARPRSSERTGGRAGTSKARQDAIMGIGDAAPIVAAASAMNSKEEEAIEVFAVKDLVPNTGAALLAAPYWARSNTPRL